MKTIQLTNNSSIIVDNNFNIIEINSNEPIIKEALNIIIDEIGGYQEEYFNEIIEKLEEQERMN